MKLKKTLSSILATTMVLSTMATSVLANEMPEIPFGDKNQRASSIMLLSNDEQESSSESPVVSWYDENETEFVLTTANELFELATLVDAGNTFEGKTVKLGNDIDLGSTLFNPIGSYRNETAFKGTFDGQYNSIKNLSQNTWELNNGYYYGDLGLGLFGLVEDAIIKNLTIDGAEISGESGMCGTVAAAAYGDCIFENITVSNANVADYQYYAGGVVGWASGDHKYINCDVDETTTVAAQWGDFDNSTGGVIGGCGGSATIYMKDCDVACRIDAYNDVTSSYQWYAYRRCGMLIGNTGKTENVNGTTVAVAPQLTAEGCTVTYGPWANYTYCEFAGTSWPYVRVQAGVSNSAYSNPRYGHPKDANGNEVVDDNHMHNDGEDHMILCLFNQLFGGGQGTYGCETAEGVTIIDNALPARSVAIVNDEYKATLQDAIDATNGNGTVTLLKDVNESAIVKGSDVVTYSNEGVTIEMDGFTLTGNIVVEEGAVANLANGTIINEDSAVSAIETKGITTLTDVDITSERHAVRVEGGTTTINGGTYKVVVPVPYEKKTLHAVNVSDGGNVVIEDGTFIGPKGTELDSGAAVNIQADSTGVIYGGNFSGGKLNTLSCKGTLTVYGGLFDQDPTAYVASGYEAVETGESKYIFAVEPVNAKSIAVELVPTDDANVYDIKLKSESYQNINEFVSAELVFKNESTTFGNAPMQYEISGITGATTAQRAADDNKKDQYIISIPDGVDNRITGREFVIGQVTFAGQGTVNFSVENSKVVATKRDTHLEMYYQVNNDTLNIDNAKIINGEIEEIKRNVVIKVAYNHALNNVWEDSQITVTLKDGFGKVITEDISEGIVTFKDVQLGRLTVTLEAPGFRKFVYNTTLEEGADENDALVLNFWNNVKRATAEDPEAEIEEGRGFTNKNFLVGDIVMDYIVDEYDLAAVTSYYGMYGIENNDKFLMYDLNRDGNIDIIDVAFVLHTLNN